MTCEQYFKGSCTQSYHLDYHWGITKTHFTAGVFDFDNKLLFFQNLLVFKYMTLLYLKCDVSWIDPGTFYSSHQTLLSSFVGRTRSLSDVSVALLPGTGQTRIPGPVLLALGNRTCLLSSWRLWGDLGLLLHKPPLLCFILMTVPALRVQQGGRLPCQPLGPPWG